MAIPVLSLLPQFAPGKSAGGDTDGNGADAHGFEGLLAVLASPAATKPAQASEARKPIDPTAVRQHLQDVLQRLTTGKVDLQAPGLGLTAKQRDQLVTNLEKVLHDLDRDGTEILDSLLAGSQVAASIKPAEVLAVAKLLATSSEGSISVNALTSNLRLLAQAVQLVANSNGQMTLQQAVEVLAPKGDEFAKQLAAVLQRQAPIETASSDAGPPDTGPPRAGAEVSATAGSDGHELTVSSELTSPADGAAEEASGDIQPTQPDVAVLASVLEALVETETKSGIQHPDSGSPAAEAGQQRPASVTASVAIGAPASVALAFAQALAGHTIDGQVLPQQKPAGGPIASGPRTSLGTQRTAATGAANAVEPAGKQQARAESGVAPTPDEPQIAATAMVGQMTPPDQGTASDQPAPQHTDTSSQAALTVTAALPAGAEASVMAPNPVPAPIPAAPARAAVEQAIVDQIVRNATVALRNGQQEFRIQLKPEFLGAMEVRVSVSDGTALVRMSTDNAATRQLIDANIGQLRQAFGAGQIRVEHVPSFSNASASWSFGQGGQQGFWQGQNPYDGSGRLPEAISFSGGSSEPQAVGAAPASPAATPASAPAGAIDIQA